MIAIAGVGLCTAQGSAAQLRTAAPLRAPVPGLGFAALDLALRGMVRWRALAEAALGELGGRRDVPIYIGSCNGAADDASTWPTAFALGDEPIASAACASGLHALWLAATRIAAGCDEVIVLAVDTLSDASRAHFAGLRVLADDPAPWQPTSTGFIPGEAAVALRLVRARDGDGLPRLTGPLLAYDRVDGDALADLVAQLAPSPEWVLGQGTGPALVDERELAAIASAVPQRVPLVTTLTWFGHTVGASGLLGAALASLGDPVRALAMSHHTALDGRPLGSAAGAALVVCRALGGACAVVTVGAGGAARVTPGYDTVAPPPPLRLPLLRRLVAEASARRPAAPPAALVVRLAAPLVPPADAAIGGRLLPSVALEITPGFVAQLVARTWGYGGPALCLVGGTDERWLPTLAAIREVHGPTLVLHVCGDELDWD